MNDAAGTRDAIPATSPVRIPMRDGRAFPVRRVYCVGRNFAEHAREMGAPVPAARTERGTPVFFLKPADAVVVDGRVPYPPGTADLQHEVELVVAIGRDAPGPLAHEQALDYVLAVGIGLDLTRRDLQAAAKAKGLPWDTGKSFDACAPVSTLLPLDDALPLGALEIALDVNGARRQQGRIADLIWDVPDILQALSNLYALRAGDLVFMGTPAGVAPLLPGDRFHAGLSRGGMQLASLDGGIDPPSA